MADMLGLSSTAYGDIERGKTDLTLSRLEQISIALGASVQELLGDALPQPQTLQPDLLQQLRTQQLELEKADLELEKLRLELAHWKRRAEELALLTMVQTLKTPSMEQRPKIGF